MDSGFATSMKTAVETLSGGFDTFSGATFTESVWFGQAADNAKNQISEKIKTKIEAVQEKLSNLVSAIEKGNEAIESKARIEELKTGLSSLNKDASDYKTKKAEWEKALSDEETKFEELVAQVKSLCS